MKQKLSLLVLNYLRFFAKLQIQKYRRFNPNFKVVGITGSAGKSSAVLACQAALEPNFKVRTNNGYNSESGVPLGILGLKISSYSLSAWLKIITLAPIKYLQNNQSIDVLLLEMGIDGPTWPKNMDFLLSVVQPDIGIFLNITPVHLENFKSLDQIAQEKAKLVNNSKIAIINSSDELVKKYTKNKHIVHIHKESIKIPKYLLPPIYQTTLASAITLAITLKLDKNTAIKNLQANFTLPPSRSTVFKGISQSTLIDSSYNSSPLACIEMLNFLKTFSPPRIAILGDMRELGLASEAEHQKIYQHALKTADYIIGIGPQTKKYFGPKAITFTYYWQAIDYLQKHSQLLNQSTILVKGSQNTIFTEEITKYLLKNKNEIPNICRQSGYWLKIKHNFKNSHSS